MARRPSSVIATSLLQLPSSNLYLTKCYKNTVEEGRVAYMLLLRRTASTKTTRSRLRVTRDLKYSSRGCCHDVALDTLCM